ncbi:RNA-binding domain-containing protein [Polychaeton citri CBS 116435]|uniref:RNA-binding domain-containing protein n=1 Tax=Polychaeton citri CBS 116435 TaxID=1314669 RepID=A0A9P4UR07_9PEZI|nr:RNA-binding domain-containing protein [Polychaeton citri CBS 116435]
MAFVRPNGQTGERGWARVQRADEAHNLYKHLDAQLIEGRRLRVHLYDISGSAAKLVRCNCLSAGAPCNTSQKTQVSELPRLMGDTAWQSIELAPQAVPTQANVPPQVVPYMTTPQLAISDPSALTTLMGNMQISAQSPGYPAPMLNNRQQPYAVQQYRAVAVNSAQQQYRDTPVYTQSSTGTPVNVSQGTIKTESRGIFVAGLNYKATDSDIRDVFGRCGKLMKCEILRDANTRRSKGSAVILYATTEEAKKAIELLNGRHFMGMKLTVRLDKEATAISPPPPPPLTSQVKASGKNNSSPIIADGSGRK